MSAPQYKKIEDKTTQKNFQNTKDLISDFLFQNKKNIENKIGESEYGKLFEVLNNAKSRQEIYNRKTNTICRMIFHKI